MQTPEQPQTYLITPPAFELSDYPDRLARVLDAHPVACVRLALAAPDAETLSRAADACRDVAHARDVAIVVADQLRLVETLGLDGVHLSDGARQVRAARKALGADAIVGAFARSSSHDGMTAGEAGADYVAFGPVGDTGLGDGILADRDLFAWWSEMIELPVVAEGGLTQTLVERLAPVTDFLAIGPEIWEAEDPAQALAALLAPLA